jgi:hypothetical protein
MSITNALASLAVRDVEDASTWYEKILGPAAHPMTEVLERRLAEGGGLQIDTAPKRAGNGSCTLVVSDIDEIARQLHTTAVAPRAKAPGPTSSTRS